MEQSSREDGIHSASQSQVQGQGYHATDAQSVNLGKKFSPFYGNQVHRSLLNSEALCNIS